MGRAFPICVLALVGCVFGIAAQIADFNFPVLRRASATIVGFVTARFGSDSGKDKTAVEQLLAKLPVKARYVPLAAPLAVADRASGPLPWFYNYVDRGIRVDRGVEKIGEDFSDQYEALVDEWYFRSKERSPGVVEPVAHAKLLLEQNAHQRVNYFSDGILIKTERRFDLGDLAEFSQPTKAPSKPEIRPIVVVPDGAGSKLLLATASSDNSAASGARRLAAIRQSDSQLSCLKVVRGDWYDPQFLRTAYTDAPKDLSRKYFVRPDHLRRVPFCLVVLRSPTIDIDSPFPLKGETLPTQFVIQRPGFEMARPLKMRSTSEGRWSGRVGGELFMLGVAYVDVTAKP